MFLARRRAGGAQGGQHRLSLQRSGELISETNAQSGKKIAASDASSLISKAQQIEATIPC